MTTWPARGASRQRSADAGVSQHCTSLPVRIKAGWLLLCVFGIGVSAGTACHAQPKFVDADAIESALKAAPDSGTPHSKGIAKGVRTIRPEPDTRLCDREQSAQLQSELGAASGLMVKSLYVEEAPSVDLDVMFDFNKASLRPDGAAQLDRLAQALVRPSLAGMRFVLAGHTDRKGDADYNDALSCERALAARIYMRDRHQIDPSRLIPMGFGFGRLKDAGDPNGAVNRRVEVRRYPGP